MNIYKCEEIIKNISKGSEESDYSVLLGNGVLLSNPKIFQNFDKELIYNAWKVFFDEFNEHYEKDPHIFQCPEQLLNAIRVELSVKLLTEYLIFYGDMPNNKNNKKAKEFLHGFKNIFTINYDPITYQTMIPEDGKHDDGFRHNNTKNCIKDIKSRTKNNGLFFLHGAFHIFSHYENDGYHYEKLSTAKGKKEEIKKRFKKALETFRNNEEQDFGITTVLESRSQNKLAWIKRDPYLKYCLDQLSKQENILTLGCSFSNDDHIIEALMLSKNLKNLKIGIFSNKDKENVEATLKRIQPFFKEKKEMPRFEENYEKINFVCTQKLSSVFWGEKSSEQCQKLDLSLTSYDELFES